MTEKAAKVKPKNVWRCKNKNCNADGCVCESKVAAGCTPRVCLMDGRPEEWDKTGEAA